MQWELSRSSRSECQHHYIFMLRLFSSRLLKLHSLWPNWRKLQSRSEALIMKTEWDLMRFRIMKLRRLLWQGQAEGRGKTCNSIHHTSPTLRASSVTAGDSWLGAAGEKVCCDTSALMIISLLWRAQLQRVEVCPVRSYRELGQQTTSCWLTQIYCRRMSSKLARQMAYKARLEEEHRLFEERCKVRQTHDVPA